MTAMRDAKPADPTRRIQSHQRSIALRSPTRRLDDLSKRPSTDCDRRYAALQREAIHCYKHVATDPNYPPEQLRAAIFAARLKSRDIRSPSSPVRQKLRHKVDVQFNAFNFFQRRNGFLCWNNVQ